MAEYLGRHPSLFMAPKELHFFGTDLSILSRRSLNLTGYLGIFADATAGQRIGEASVWYLYSRRAATEIKAFRPDARIIIMLRNPTDMIYSQHSQFLYNGNEDIKEFQSAIAAESERKRGQRIPKTVVFREGLYYRDTACFTQQVERYLNVFGRDRVHIAIYDDLKRDAHESYRATLRFLGVDEGFCPGFNVVNSNRYMRSLMVRDLLRRPPGELRNAARSLLPETARRWLRRSLNHANVVQRARRPMELSLRRQLQREFAPEVERLGKLLQRDLSHWNKC
jgi:hypothetical protein